MARHVLLDCDPGVDDALALMVLVADPDVELVGITTVHGNVTSDRGAQNALQLLDLLGRDDVPVFRGATDPLTREFDGGAEFVHGPGGLGGIELGPASRAVEAAPAVEAILAAARAHPGELDLLAIGPLTNVALALAADPELPRLVRSVTLMGGTATAPGNVSPVAEANIGNDPEAAQAVLTAGWPVTMVGLDVTMGQLLEEEHRRQLLDAPGEVARFTGRMLDFYFDFYRQTFDRPCSALHDPLAAALLTGLVTADLAPVVPVEVDTTDGPGRGQTICDLRGRYRGFPPVDGASVSVVLQVTTPLAPLLVDLIRSL